MKLALISDIHGNSVALDAVLADIDSQGSVDEVWVLGDLAALGPDPVGVLERLNALPKVRFLRGNTDRYLVKGDRPPPSLDQAAQDPSLIPHIVQMNSSFAWTLGALAVTGWMDFMKALPLELTATEFRVLELLSRDAGHVVARETLTRAALGRELTAYDRAIDTHVSNLRRKLGRDSAGRSPIRSIRGAGYQLATARD